MATKKKRIMISLSDDKADKLARLSDETGLSKSGLVTLWINKELEKTLGE